MIKLPRNVPIEIRSAFQTALEQSSWSMALEHIAQAVRKLFGAGDILASFEQGNLLAADGSHQIFFRGDLTTVIEGAEDKFPKQWCNTSIHRFLRRDLKARLSGLSYSAFSWPYPSFEITCGSTADKLVIPREFTLFLPLSSELLVRAKGQTEFFGYLALFFDHFPNLSDAVVQLIMTLPELLSSIAQALASKSIEQPAVDIGGYAHDMKRYLLVNREYLNVIKSQDESALDLAFSGLERSLLRALQQTNSILLLDKDEHGKLKVKPMALQLNELVQETARDMKILFDSERVELSLNLAPDIPQAFIDPAIFPSVICNLLDNALKYSSPCKKVLVETNYNGGDCVQLAVTDNGSVLNPEEYDRIFHRGYRGTNSGSCAGNGLGLYLVRRVVDAHGGRVVFEQKPNRTKSFTVHLPRAILNT